MNLHGFNSKSFYVIYILTAIVLVWLFVGRSDNATTNTVDSVSTEEVVEKQVEADTNLRNSIEAFLVSWEEDKGVTLKLPTDSDSSNKSGYYVYSIQLGKMDKLIYLKGGEFELTLPEGKVATYEQFTGESKELELGTTALAIIQFKDNNAVNAFAYQLKSSGKVLTKTLESVVLPREDVGKKDEEKTKEDLRSYKELTADQWRGMTLLTAREIKKKNMAPVISVPNQNINSIDYLIGTYYYVIGGVVKSGDAEKTVLTVQDGKNVTADFAVPDVADYLGQPVWLHIVTHNSEIQNIEVQVFSGAEPSAMLAGMNSYIQVAGLE